MFYHSASLFISKIKPDRLLEGVIRSKLDNGQEHVFSAGESWVEKPGARHTMSSNASATEPAKLLALFIADSKSKDLVTIDKK